MAIVGILLFVTAPFLFGAGIVSKRGERNVGYLKGYLVGFLSLFAMFFIETLAMLKLDLDLKRFEWIVVGTMAFMFVAGAVLLMIKRPKFATLQFEKSMLWFVVPAILLFTYSYCYLTPSLANDDTWEFVATSVAKGSVYEYSSMTGRLMKAGLPIFNKILAMPLLYVVLADFFGISVNISAGLIVPAIVFVLNLSIVYRIGKELAVSNLSYYMIAYMLLLMGGTYLPNFGVPVTLGYNGYAVAYGVVIPTALLLLLKKKYLWTLVTLMTAAPLVRIDRVFFALTTPFESLKAINAAGKITGVYVVAIAAALLFKAVSGAKIKWHAFLVPSIFVAYMSEKLKNCLKENRENVWYSLGIALVILSAVNYQPFDDAETYFERNEQEAVIKATLSELGDGMVWAPIEFVSVARRLDGNFESLFGRDTDDLSMAGYNYENDYDMSREYKNAIYNVAIGADRYTTENETWLIVEFAVIEGTTYAVLPTDDGYTVKRLSELR